MDPTFNPLVARSFPGLFIILDLVWLSVLLGLLWWSGRRTALAVGLIAGVIYFAVDFGGFYALLGTRSVINADPFWLLLWLSFSYGITNFVWIWVLLSRDVRQVEWSVLIITAWIGVAFVAQAYGSGDPIQISRGTGGYHGGMAAVLAIGYALLVVHNLRPSTSEEARAPVLRLLAIGIGVQLDWESVLLLSGIRPAGFQPLVVNSLIETNLGLPYAWMIHRWASRRWPDAGARSV